MSLSIVSTVYCDTHSQRLWHSQENRNRFFFFELSCFFDNPADVDNLISGSSAFPIPKWRGTKKPLDESERGERKSWLKAQHPEN